MQIGLFFCITLVMNERELKESKSVVVVGWQGAHYPSVPRQQSPRRVDVYFSSWRIRAGRISENIFEVACCLFLTPSMET